MHPLAQVLMTTSAAAVAVGLFLILREMRMIAHLLHKLLKRREIYTTSPHSALPEKPSGNGYAIYMYEQGAWRLERDLSAPGCECSPPTMPGRFENQVIRRESRPKC